MSDRLDRIERAVMGVAESLQRLCEVYDFNVEVGYSERSASTIQADLENVKELLLKTDRAGCKSCQGAGCVLSFREGPTAELRRCSVCSDGTRICGTDLPCYGGPEAEARVVRLVPTPKEDG